MEANETFTDRLVSEILKSKLSVEDQKILIYKRYDQKGFTMIGARKEVRIVQERIQDNMVNKFDDIIATTLTILGACVSYLIIDSIFERGIVGIVLKILMPIIVFAVLSSVFSETLKEIKDNVDIPFVLIGGINLDNVGQLKQFNPDGYAIISAILKEEDIYAEVKKWLDVI